MGLVRSQSSGIDPQEIHDILRNERRRRVIEQLQYRVEPMSVRELSELIGELESNESPPPRALRESVYNSLHQTHLPKLDGKGIIEYDEDRKQVYLQESAREVSIYMEVVTPYGITWGEYYRTLGVVALLTIVAVTADLLFFVDVPSLLLASAFLLVFMLSTAYQLWTQRWFYLRLIRGGEFDEAGN